jgi:hypothetical protein
MADPRRKSPFKGLTMRLPSAGPPPSSTAPSFVPPDFADVTETDMDVGPPTDMSNRGESTQREEESGIEIALVREDATPRRARAPWRAIEVWTKNRVYGMDSSFICIEVVDRASGKLDPNHPILGGRLGGGRKRGTKGQTLTHPLPVPGTEAMFLRAKKQGYTSVVERVILRVRALRVRNSVTWDQVLDVDQDSSSD